MPRNSAPPPTSGRVQCQRRRHDDVCAQMHHSAAPDAFDWDAFPMPPGYVGRRGKSTATTAPPKPWIDGARARKRSSMPPVGRLAMSGCPCAAVVRKQIGGRDEKHLAVRGYVLWPCSWSRPQRTRRRRRMRSRVGGSLSHADEVPKGSDGWRIRRREHGLPAGSCAPLSNAKLLVSYTYASLQKAAKTTLTRALARPAASKLPY